MFLRGFLSVPRECNWLTHVHVLREIRHEFNSVVIEKKKKKCIFMSLNFRVFIRFVWMNFVLVQYIAFEYSEPDDYLVFINLVLWRSLRFARL